MVEWCPKCTRLVSRWVLAEWWRSLRRTDTDTIVLDRKTRNWPCDLPVGAVRSQP